MTKNSRIHNNQISIAYKMVLSILVFTAIIDRAGIFDTEHQLHTLYSFTTISNAFVLVVTLISIYKLLKYPTGIGITLSYFRTVAVIMVLITGVVYHFILLPQKLTENPDYQIFTYGNIIAHYISPIVMCIDWMLYDEKGRIKKWFPLACSAMPFLYFIIASLYGYYGSAIKNRESSYVYFFMDFDNLGLSGVMRWVLLIIVIVLVLSYIVYFMDFFLAKKNKE